MRIKGINLYMSVGGVTPKNSTKDHTYSLLKKSIGITEDILMVQKSGIFYDYGAPIGMDGQKNPSYDEAIKSISTQFKAPEENIVIDQLKGKFGRKTFLITAKIYKTKEDKEKIEPKQKKKEGEEEKPAETAETPAEAPKEEKKEEPKAEEKKEETAEEAKEEEAK